MWSRLSSLLYNYLSGKMMPKLPNYSQLVVYLTKICKSEGETPYPCCQAWRVESVNEAYSIIGCLKDAYPQCQWRKMGPTDWIGDLRKGLKTVISYRSCLSNPTGLSDSILHFVKIDRRKYP